MRIHHFLQFLPMLLPQHLVFHYGKRRDKRDGRQGGRGEGRGGAGLRTELRFRRRFFVPSQVPNGLRSAVIQKMLHPKTATSVMVRASHRPDEESFYGSPPNVSLQRNRRFQNQLPPGRIS